MNIQSTPLAGACLIETEPFQDHRGKFARLFCQQELKKVLNGKVLEQINYSVTVKKGAIRGLHFQYPPMAEVKMARCIRGTVFDVIVDLRKRSPTFLKWHGETLSQDNMKMMYVPEGFAHGFQTLEDNCELLYLHTASYSPKDEGGLRYDDPMIQIEWPLDVTEVSEKDSNYPFLTSDFAGIFL